MKKALAILSLILILVCSISLLTTATTVIKTEIQIGLIKDNIQYYQKIIDSPAPDKTASMEFLQMAKDDLHALEVSDNAIVSFISTCHPLLQFVCLCISAISFVAIPILFICVVANVLHILQKKKKN